MKGLFLFNKTNITITMTVLVALGSVDFTSFGLCSIPEFHRHHGHYKITLAVGFRNPQSEILKIFLDRLNPRNAIVNWT